MERGNSPCSDEGQDRSMAEIFYRHHEQSGLTPGLITQFRAIIYDYFKESGRDFPWRKTSDPYHILVSEIMLQQTQTDRVVPKYETFIRRFPTVSSLATVTLEEVLRVWQGLGYNRRAAALKRCAEMLLQEYDGLIPEDRERLLSLPGVGPYTADAVTVFAFGKPAVLIETNIRAVYLFFFFPGKEKVRDAQLAPLIEETVDRADPASWYSGLMDYGAMLKRCYLNPTRGSAHHVAQTAFSGSSRQLRGQIIRLLLEGGRSEEELTKVLKVAPGRIRETLGKLRSEGLITESLGQYRIAG